MLVGGGGDVITGHCIQINSNNLKVNKGGHDSMGERCPGEER